MATPARKFFTGPQTPDAAPDLIGIRPEMRRVKVKEINIDHGEYQRIPRPNWVRKIKGNFDAFLLDPVTLSERIDGSLWAMDGQHRLTALVELGMEDQEVDAIVYRGLTIEQEARRFNTQGYRLGLTPGEQFRAELREGNPSATIIAAIVGGSGFGLNLTSKNDRAHGRITAVATLKKIQRKYRSDLLTEALGALADGFGTELGPRGETIHGVAMFLRKYAGHGKYDRKRLVAGMRMSNLGGLETEAMVLAKTIGVTGATATGIALLRRYNANLRAQNRLPNWETYERVTLPRDRPGERTPDQGDDD